MPENSIIRSSARPAEGRTGQNSPIPPQLYRTANYACDMEADERAVPFAHYLWILKHHCWKILAFVFTCVAATLMVSSRITPIYESTATIDVDRQMPTAVIGQESTRPALNDADQFLATQVKLIQSDSVLRSVAQQYKVVEWGKESAEPIPAKTGFVQDAPIRLANLKVTRPPNTYLLLISYRCPNPVLAADVANGIAHSYIEHTYDIRFRSSSSLSAFMEKQLDELKTKMEHSSGALAQFERELNVINREEKTNILSARLLQLNTEYTNAQSDRVRKEASFQSVRSGNLEAAQVSTQGESLKKLLDRLDDAVEKFAQIKMHYGDNHPEYRKAVAQVSEVQRQLDWASKSIARRVELEYQQAANRESMLRRAVADVKAESDRLNARSYEYQALKREAEADKKLYDELIQKIKEAGINAGFQNSAIRLADVARPALKPVLPNFKVNLLLAFLCSTLLATGAALVTGALDKTIRDPEQVKSLLNSEMVGSLPVVRPWKRRLRFTQKNSKALIRWGEAPNHPLDVFKQAVSSLRNSILLGSFDRQLKSLMLTSATPAEGKTTVAVHLAVANAQRKHKTLLIDCDLRRPGVSRMLGLPSDLGLATVLSNGLPWKDSLLKLDGVPDLDILPSAPSQRLPDQIGEGLRRILDDAVSEYDLIIVDAPPMLGFPEPLEIATAVDGVVVITLAGQTNHKAVSSVFSALRRVRANVVGLVLNQVTSEMNESYQHYGYGNYAKYYRNNDD